MIKLTYKGDDTMYIGTNGKKFYKAALHQHSTLSDGKLTPEEIAKIYKQSGYDALALTDHWKYGESRELEGLHIISGCEYNMGGNHKTMHIVGFGMRSDPEIPNNEDRQYTVNKIREAGGIAVLAHPAWSLNSMDDVRHLEGIDATEIYNSVSEQGQSLRAYSDHFVDLCARNGYYYGILATDDAHYYDGIDDRKGWVMVEAEELSDRAIVEAIKARRFYSTQGPHLQVEYTDGKLIIDCSPCSVIAVLSDGAWLPRRAARGSGLTHYEYDICQDDLWARVEVRDPLGKRAWSNIVDLS